MRVRLHELAHARAGDKGEISMISVIAYEAHCFDALADALTPERVAAQLGDGRPLSVRRYALPELAAFNFVVVGLLGGGVTRSLALDAHGKSLSSVLLAMELDVPDEVVEDKV